MDNPRRVVGLPSICFIDVQRIVIAREHGEGSHIFDSDVSLEIGLESHTQIGGR